MPLDPTWLRRRYEHDQALVADIAAEADVDPSTVHRALRAYAIPLRGVVGHRSLLHVSTATIRRTVREAPTLRDAARRLSVSETTLRERLRADGLRPPRKTPDMRVMARRYRAGASLAELAEDAGVSVRAVGRWLRAVGVELRPAGRPRSTRVATGLTCADTVG